MITGAADWPAMVLLGGQLDWSPVPAIARKQRDAARAAHEIAQVVAVAGVPARNFGFLSLAPASAGTLRASVSDIGVHGLAGRGCRDCRSGSIACVETAVPRATRAGVADPLSRRFGIIRAWTPS